MPTLRLIPPEQFTLTVSQVGRQLTFSIRNSIGASTWGSRSMARGPKIYLVGHRDTLGSVVYAGETCRSMQQRFADSFRNVDASQRHYPWSLSPNIFRLCVWSLDGRAVQKPLLKAIEAELTFAVRVMQLGWPTHQRGITLHHFRTDKRFADASAIAAHIIEQYFEVLAAPSSLTAAKRQRIDSAKKNTIKLLTALTLFPRKT